MKRAILASGALYGTIVLPENLTLSTTLDPPITSASEVFGHSLAVFGWTPTGFLVVTCGEVVVVPYSWWVQFAATAYAVNVIAGERPPEEDCNAQHDRPRGETGAPLIHWWRRGDRPRGVSSQLRRQPLRRQRLATVRRR